MLCVQDDGGKEEVGRLGGDLVPELIAQEVSDRRLHHEADCECNVQRRSDTGAIALADQLHYYSKTRPIT